MVTTKQDIKVDISKYHWEAERKLEHKKSTFVSGHNVVTSTRTCTCIVYGMQLRAIQGMLDFDHLCGRDKPSVSAMVFPFDGNGFQKFYWGTSEVLVPVYTSIKQAAEKHKDATVMVNFASFRSVHETSLDCIENAPSIKTIAIIAEGVPERQTRDIIKAAGDK